MFTWGGKSNIERGLEYLRAGALMSAVLMVAVFMAGDGCEVVGGAHVGPQTKTFEPSSCTVQNTYA